MQNPPGEEPETSLSVTPPTKWAAGVPAVVHALAVRGNGLSMPSTAQRHPACRRCRDRAREVFTKGQVARMDAALDHARLPLTRQAALV